MYQGSAQVEGLTARLINSLPEADAVWEHDEVPVLVDEAADSVHAFAPDIVIDAIIAKRNLDTSSTMAPLVIALGPGFSVGADADVIVETKRGHNLGRIIRSGSAAPNSGVPGNIAGYSKEVCCTHPAQVFCTLFMILAVLWKRAKLLQLLPTAVIRWR